MTTNQPESALPQEFAAAVTAVRAAAFREEVRVTEIPAPGNLAKHAIAFSADVLPSQHGDDSDLGSARFVLLYDPDPPEMWLSNFRVICYAQAPLDFELATDLFIQKVSWSWLTDSLEANGAAYSAASGTATKIISTGFGELAKHGDGAKLEFRASWSPLESAIDRHILAWADLLGRLAGLPPSSSVDSLTVQRNKKITD